ncbi:hypothetical protein E7T09_10745 [Deinococcus sp. KSM4-11]|uniref:hypothetical protein n=1 Tax=Deinococcus sp. KSM4-11 TaxID=2568654 RepID=UPI0010A47BD7|nr:hypothetical protein [Deinococcus sp. KSM4-11]THF86575.1 hypothetical protein E7T09_10745 [Deinococcus sp. KSM4-11]
MFTLLSTSARPALRLRSLLTATALFVLLPTLTGRAPQDAQAQAVSGPTQTLVINYPNSGVLSGKVGSPMYRGLVYVTIVPASADLVRQYGSGPVAATELGPSQRDVRTLPLGTYEVRYAVRNGSELRTFILRDVILRADRGNALVVEVNTDAKTTIVGGDLSAQQMATMIRQLQAQVATLQQQVTALTPK